MKAKDILGVIVNRYPEIAEQSGTAYFEDMHDIQFLFGQDAELVQGRIVYTDFSKDKVVDYFYVYDCWGREMMRADDPSDAAVKTQDGMIYLWRIE